MTETKKSKSIISGEGSVSLEAVSLLNPVVDEAVDDADAGAELELRQVSVPHEGHGERLDRVLASMVPEFSRSYLQQLIEAGAVTLNGAPAAKSSAKVKAGDQLQVELKPTPQSQAFKPEAMALNVVFEDEHLLVIDKPAGLVVHPAPGHWSGTLLNGLLARDTAASQLPRAGIVHRLDKDTSGLMVVARRRQVMDELVKLIAARDVSREYIAMGQGEWKGSKTKEVDLPIGRDPRNRLRMAVVDLDKNSGKTAFTTISMLDTTGKTCLVRCKLHTGRTHQIRVHMASLGHPLVSDDIYGGAVAGGLGRQALHAWRLAFRHPATDEEMVFKSALPEDIQSALKALGLIYNQIQ